MTRAINDTNTGWGSAFQTLDMGDMGTFHSILLLVL